MLPSARLLAGLRPGWCRALSRPARLLAHRQLGALRTNSSHKSPLAPETSNAVKFDPSEPRLAIAFTCTAGGCNHRSAHTFTKRAYERGIVLIQCPSCKNRHLIADNLGWFKDDTQDGRLKNVEELLRVRGERVQRGTLDAEGDIEISDAS